MRTAFIIAIAAPYNHLSGSRGMLASSAQECPHNIPQCPQFPTPPLPPSVPDLPPLHSQPLPNIGFRHHSDRSVS